MDSLAYEKSGGTERSRGPGRADFPLRLQRGAGDGRSLGHHPVTRLPKDKPNAGGQTPRPRPPRASLYVPMKTVLLKKSVLLFGRLGIRHLVLHCQVHCLTLPAALSRGNALRQKSREQCYRQPTGSPHACWLRCGSGREATAPGTSLPCRPARVRHAR